MSVSRILKIMVLLIAVTANFAASAANRKDLARARQTGRLAECNRCDLSGANLENAFFQLAVLIEVNFSGANLNGANLAGAQMNNANLSNASLVYANLSGARLEGADLRGAKFSHAWLNWAWFEGAKFDGADFSDAVMIGAQIQGADLSKATGLTKEQMDRACGDGRTKLPPGLNAPYCFF